MLFKGLTKKQSPLIENLKKEYIRAYLLIPSYTLPYFKPSKGSLIVSKIFLLVHFYEVHIPTEAAESGEKTQWEQWPIVKI